MRLNDIAQSDQLVRGLFDVAGKFAGPHLRQHRSAPTPSWLSSLPASVCELHGLLTWWHGIVPEFQGGYGIQDSLFLPPQRLGDGEMLLVQENQGGFCLRIQKKNGGWLAQRIENTERRDVQSIAGYLVSFALQEMVMSAPLWAIDEGMENLVPRMMDDLTLIWTDTENGGYFPHGDVRFYWHKAGALVLCDERGRGDIGCHDIGLAPYFEGCGFYDVR
ncbi:hypothetical protein [Aporhodopirellula aestuarii]|uniref:Uncharacterized protein n=1 Tax=Aporhodopirellula aestuarii TaxID=2950107 RepID=A0ABT0U410_9BACT|nr:hypothetical protein [Aporhodopirellula aestuarii]MCM2371637.1 hypothetical protein [Aporhodopirellula aestuarii]